MNFRKIYKDANNKICADKTKIDNIFIVAEKKKTFIEKYYKQISVCAAAVLLVFSVTILTQYKNNTPDPKNNVFVSDTPALKHNTSDVDNNKTIADDSSGSDDKTFSTSGDNLDDASLVQPDDVPVICEDSPTTESEPEHTDNTAFKISPNPQAISEAVKSTENTDSEDVSSDKIVSPGSNSSHSSAGGAGGGGGGSASGGGSRRIGHELNTQDYYDYLNINIPEMFSVLPNGMSFVDSGKIPVVLNSSGNLVDDAADFIALSDSDPTKIISVSTSKLHCEASNVFNNSADKTLINNHSVVIVKSDSLFKAYYQYKNVWFGVTAANISETDFNLIILNSLK